ncbi:MAG: transaminase [Chloroflexota bacterium]|nr:transaminase [Chloroflexota bacterium]
MVDRTGVDTARLSKLSDVENARFVAERPRSTALAQRAAKTMPRGVPMSWMDDLFEHPPVWVAHGQGSHFVDVDGHDYVDMYIADMSAFCGHAPAPVVAAVARRMALGNQFLMPEADAIAVAEHLSGRYGFPKWQFTLSATNANTEIIRLARAATGRDIVLVFDGKYHGHGDSTLVVVEDGAVVPEFHGLPSSISGQAKVVGFNDLEALERVLAPRDVALVLAEPAMTNAGFLLPEPGFHEALRRLTRDTGTLLAIDETHTLVTAYAGLARKWALESDFVTVGKSIAAGVPLGAYGMTEDIGALIRHPDSEVAVSGIVLDEVATGGTLFANPLSMTAGRAALTEVLTEAAFERTAELGERMASGLRAAIADTGVSWCVVQEGSHACYFFVPQPPGNGAESRADDDIDLRALIRVYMANRGVWESGWWLGPTVSVAHTAADVDRYVAVFGEFLEAAN